MGRTMFDKLWEMHSVADMGDGNAMLFVDRCYLHDLTGPLALNLLEDKGYSILDNAQVVASCDHTIAATPDRTVDTTDASRYWVPIYEAGCKKHGIQFYGPNDPQQGIVHVIGPERGLSLPGTTIVCGDSHTCTHGAMGALAWGVGSSDLAHALATRTLIVKRPRTLRLHIEGEVDFTQVDAMDIGLYLLSKLGADFGNGYAVEYTGSVIQQMEMEDRMTICNLTVELGSEFGLIAPDEKTFAYLKTCPDAPKGEMLAQLQEAAIQFTTDPTAVFDKEVVVDVTGLTPHISWGISPAHTSPIEKGVPGTAEEARCATADYEKALNYMGLAPEQQLQGLKVERVFIGSCSNGRLSNLKKVAAYVKGKKVSPKVEAWVVAGSMEVKRQAEELGLHTVFQEAGFMWGAPSCTLCSGSSGEKVAPYHRCVSTSNRNFIGRQGPNARTHLAGPLTAARAALLGCITGSEGI